MISVDIVSDTVCPWCFIGKRRFERAMASRPEYDYTIGWRPFQLNPEMAPAGMARDKYLAEKFGDRERSAEVYKHVRAAGRAERRTKWRVNIP